MTIKKRLFLSNILMIMVPVAVALLIAGCCMGGLWLFLTHGGGLGVEDGWGFYWYSHTAEPGNRTPPFCKQRKIWPPTG